MRLFVQWARDVASDWEAVDSADWAATAYKPEPGDSDRADSAAGWVAGLNVQGNVFHADHVAVEEVAAGGVRVFAWNDDPDDWPGSAHGRIVTIYPLAPDARFGGKYNTNATQVLYAEGAAASRLRRLGYRPERWNRWPNVTASTRHGIWLSDSLFVAHLRSRTEHSWREWTDGVPADRIEGGRVRR